MRKHLFVTLLLACGSPYGAQLYAAPEPQQQSQGVVTIKGTVLDENDEPAIGASVTAKGMKNGVATDAFGNFSIAVRPGTQLTVALVGYQSQTVKAAQDMIVYLQPTTEVLDQLVVVGYGTQKRANLTGAVATVDVSRTMDSRPVQDVTKALQGAVPGLTITTTNGGINSDATIQVRGLGTLSNSQVTTPLIVVDGVPTDDLNFVNPEDIAEISVLKDAASSAVYGARAAFGVVLITTKNPSRKDRVSVSYTNNFAWSQATVLPRFANNVDNIEASLASYYRGSGSANTEVGGMSYEKLLPYAQAWLEQHGGKPYTDMVELHPYVDKNNVGDYYVDPETGTWLRYAEWDVQKTLFNSAAPSQKHNVSLEGTSGKTQYRASFGYDSKQGLLKYGPDKMHRYMASVNVQTEIFKWMKAGVRANFSQREYTEPNTSRNSYQYLWRWPSYMETYGYVNDADGKPMLFRNDIANRTLAHTDKWTGRQTRLQAWTQINVIPDVTIQADFTYDIRTSREADAYVPFTAWDTWQATAFQVYQNTTQASSFVRRNSADTDMWTMNVFATYDKTFAKDHGLKVMVGASADQRRYDMFQVLRRGVVDYDLANLALTNGDQYTTAASADRRATAGFFGRVNYDYKGIYLLEVNGRYDGSSRFPAHKQWAFFPSVSAGYRFSEEKYFEPLKTWWNNGKIRASYGHIGNENVGANQFLSTISALAAGSTYWINSAGNKISAFTSPSLVSQDLTWERVVTTDVGLDLGFFNNSLNFSFDWYQRDTKDMLSQGETLPSVLGASAPLTNAGTLRTRGWELSIGYNHSFGDANVYATFNIGDAVSKITKWSDNVLLYQAIPGSYARGRYHEGQTVGEIYGFEFDRFFEESDFTGKDGNQWIYAPGVASQKDLQASGTFVYGPGDVKFKDLDGDGKITVGKGTVDDHGDVKVIGNMLPRYEYSFRLGGSWKGFDIDFFFQGVGKRKMWYVSSYVIPMAQTNTGIFEHQLDANQYIFNDNHEIVGYDIDQNNFYPVQYAGGFGYAKLNNNMLGQGTYNFLPSDRYLLNMAYLRMKNITFGYTLPVAITQKALIQRARIYFSAENPFFVYNGASKYKIDAELNTGEGGMGVGAYGRTNPMMRSYSFGVQVTF